MSVNNSRNLNHLPCHNFHTMATVLVLHPLPLSSNSNHLPCHSLRLMVFKLKVHHRTVNSIMISNNLRHHSSCWIVTIQLQPQKHQLSACSHLAYEFPNHPTGMMSTNNYGRQQPVPSFSGWLPQQQPYGELSPEANTRLFPFPKRGFPSPPDRVFYCHLLEFCPPQVSSVTAVIKCLNPRAESYNHLSTWK